MVNASDPFVFSGELAKLSDAGIAAVPLRCVHVRNRAAKCTRCADACPSGTVAFRAISDGEGQVPDAGRGFTAEFSVVPERCSRCGACVMACPTGALFSLGARAGTCGKDDVTDGTHCVSDEAFAAHGAAGVSAGCESTAACVSTCCGPVHVGAGGILPQQVPERRQRLWQGVSAGGVLPNDTSVTWGRLSIDIKVCRACRMCAAFCPTGALTCYDAQGERGLQHQPSKCVDCRLCADTCSVGAITVEPGTEPGKLRRDAVVRYPLPEPQWLPTGTNQIREKMKSLINTKTLA